MDRTEGSEGRTRSARAEVFQLALIVATAVLLAFAVQAYAVKPFKIPSGSMLPTLEPGQRVLVDRATEHLGYTPKIGDVVVFNPPQSAVRAGIPKCAEPEPRTVCAVSGSEHADQAFIKRVVAGPGDTLSVRGGTPIVNGKPVVGDWRTIPCGHASGCDFPREIVVPDDSWFMMGDNRPGSDDSRFWGPVPRDWIIGRAVVTYWPPSRIGGL
jgi:signal peptidase I